MRAVPEDSLSRLARGIDRLIAAVGQDEAWVFLRAHGFWIEGAPDPEPTPMWSPSLESLTDAALARLS